MSESMIRVERQGPMAEVVLSRPERMNALNQGFWQDFPATLDALDADPAVRVVLLRSEGRHFSSGMDLDFFPTVREHEDGEPGRYREWLRRKILFLQHAINRMETLRAPVVAVVQGACIGGALDLLCGANLRYCSQDAQFRIHEINIGMMADLGVLQRLPRLIPPGVVQELALTGRSLSADEALRHGLVNAVGADADAALTLAREAAAQIAERSPLAVAGTKAALHHARDHSIADGLEFASLWNAAMFISHDVPQAIQAQREKRKPDFPDVLP